MLVIILVTFVTISKRYVNKYDLKESNIQLYWAFIISYYSLIIFTLFLISMIIYMYINKLPEPPFGF